jgi:hypothetical protein
MGSYDGAEICELAVLFILNSLAKKYGKERVGLYRDGGPILLSGTSARLADKARKDLHELLEEFHLKINAEITHQCVDFLDVTFNLTYAMKAINPIVNPITTHFSLTAVQIILLKSRSDLQLQVTCVFHSYRPTKKHFQKPLLCTKLPSAVAITKRI